ncbi:MAG: GntR family transcriptional regulator [Pseudomonadota bacterium]
MIKQPKLSEVITERLENMILDGTLSAGEKLLPERVLAEKFQVSRPSLREAIQNLTVKGLIVRKQGGGTFVSNSLNTRMTDPLMELLSSRPESQFDLLEFRHSLEGMAAFYAALRGQQEDFDALSQALENLPYSKVTTAQEASALSDFYIVMAKASSNVVLLHVMRTMQPMLLENIRANLVMLREGADVEETIVKQRKAVVEAIVRKDPVAARDASHEHLAFIEKTLLEINKSDVSIQRSLRRIPID